ncbi:hypothetical protein [Pseudophaeobacter sp. EL27]|uniref:hypothetical protein n=1 Tax=Pseudophaeobacter sp. EL27 TaxID=2107580 RepID=UPI000EFCDA5C|nr:hypothetical protein [Pseudophaeobacter sp. EL27]
MITSPLSSNLSSKQPAKLTAALCLLLTCALMPMATAAKEAEAAKQVTVLGRTWVVAPAAEAPGFYHATRLNVELLPERPPAVLSARQAVRAFRHATGCSANLDTLYRDITGTYFASLICPRK